MMMLSNIFDNIFDDRLFGFFPAVTGLTPHNEPVMKSDICEYDDHYDLTMELPGYSKDDIKVDLDDGTLTIQAVHNNTHDEKDEQGRVIRSERYTGNCQRSFYVGSEVKKEDIQASFNDGILHLNIHKPALEAPANQPRTIEIQ